MKRFAQAFVTILAMLGMVAFARVAGTPSAPEPASSTPPVEVQQSAVPVGSVVAFAGVFNDSNDPNWRVCRGQSVRRADFPRLFAVIGTAWGQGDNPGTTFSLPDLRGVFLRGVAQGTPTDPDRDSRTARNGGNSGDRVGSFQGFATALPRREFATGNESTPHTHEVTNTNARTEGGNPNTFGDGDERGVTPTAAITMGPNDRPHTHNVTGGGDQETRPVNVYVNYICKVR